MILFQIDARNFEKLQVKRKMSSAFHPQTDGQSERTNQTLEQYLRCYTNYQQDDWSNLLPLAEFAYNNAENTSIQMTPFYANYAFHPKIDFLKISNDETTSPMATWRLNQLKNVSAELAFNLKKAQDSAKIHADKKRIQHYFKIKDKVWLLRRNLKTSRPSEKLDFRRLGPFEIISKINDVAFKLKLPDSMKIHPVFHVSLLEPYTAPLDSKESPSVPDPIIINGELEYEVETILDSRIKHNRLEYLVKWMGYETVDSTWEPVQNLTNCNSAVSLYHSRFPQRPSFKDLPSSSRRARA